MLRKLRCLLPVLAMPALLLVVACREMPTAMEPVEISSAAPLLAIGSGLPPFDEDMAELGDLIFDDKNLSINQNQACNSCHEAAWGFTGPDASINAAGAVYEGSIAGRFGDRKPPSSAYSTLPPVLQRTGDLFVGGNFWDGRATGWRLGNPAIEQAQGPFLNPVEQGLRDEACVVYRVSRASYAGMYKQVFGNAIESIGFPADIDSQCSVEGGRFGLGVINADDRAKIQTEYDNIAIAIAMYEESHNLFSSKFDAVRLGRDRFTGQERRGFELFQGKANCASCHTIDGPNPAFTDHTYDNLGVPANPDNPAGRNFRDPGLGGFLATLGGHPQYSGWTAYAASERGKMRVPTLRNVALMPKHKGGNPKPVKAYMHNGAFKSLEEVVQFYNTRDVLRTCGPRDTRKDWGKKCWPEPQFPETMNREELGNLGLTQGEVNAIVAFLGTLSDGHFPRRKGKHFAGD